LYLEASTDRSSLIVVEYIITICTSHYIRPKALGTLIKDYVQKVRGCSESILECLNAGLKKSEDLAEIEKATENLEQILVAFQGGIT
jgi:hypothetical protein